MTVALLSLLVLSGDLSPYYILPIVCVTLISLWEMGAIQTRLNLAAQGPMAMFTRTAAVGLASSFETVTASRVLLYGAVLKRLPLWLPFRTYLASGLMYPVKHFILRFYV